jgi:hypothetical protein
VFPQKTLIASLIYSLIYYLSGRLPPAQELSRRLDWRRSTPISASFHLQMAVVKMPLFLEAQIPANSE